MSTWRSCTCDIKTILPLRDKLKQMEKRRKIIKSYLGIAFSVANVITLLICFFAAIYYINLYNSSSFYSSKNVERFMQVLGFSPRPLLELKNEGDRIYVLTSLGCYLLACLPHLHVNLRALIEPTYAAGKPNANVNNLI